MTLALHQRIARKTLHGLKSLAKRSQTIRSLLYDSHNARTFTGLYMHERMLNDTVRIAAYRAGIAAGVKPGDVVLDLGTGTGVLAYFAAMSGARKVYAVDHSPFIDVARQIAHRNGFSQVEFVQQNSREFTPAEPIDVIVHEQLDRELFGENMVENLLDLKRRVLAPGGRILPGAFEFYVEPLAIKPHYRVPRLWDTTELGFDLGFLRDSPLIEPYRDDHKMWEIQAHYADYFLCEPEPLIAFDINTLVSQADIPRHFEVQRTVTRAGTVDGFSIHFRALFDAQTVLDTSPLAPQTHWITLAFRTDRRRVSVGDRLAYTIDLPVLIDRYSWRLKLAG